MMVLTTEEIIKLHTKLIAKTGGLDGIRDIGLLESAVYSVSGGYDDIELYTAVEEKAARFAYAIISNHAFIDGNKRIGIMVMLMTLALNEVTISYSQAELVQLGLALASGKSSYESVLEWIKQHKKD